MAAPHEKLAESLDVLKGLQSDGRRVFRSDELSRVHRERLVANGFLQEVIKGWLISSSPEARKGDTTPWYASFWEFCSRYCGKRFADKWYLSAEQSLWLHGERTLIPNQVVVCSPNGTNHTYKLPFATSIYELKVPEMPPATDLTLRDGLRIFSAAASLVGVSETFLERNPVESQVVLASLPDASDLLRLLLDGGHSAKAGCLAGGLRHIGRGELADEIINTMEKAGYHLREMNPFDNRQRVFAMPPGSAPIVGRIEMMWTSMRDTVLEVFPKAPGLPEDKQAYLHHVDEIYKSDAYHSLSIEGYSVTSEIIDKVRQGNWHPEVNQDDKKTRDALAAYGYWHAFQNVKEAVTKVLQGENPGTIARAGHQEWYRDLFQPCVTAGLVRAGALAGYRNIPVYLRTSRYVPPRWEAVRDAMPAFFDRIENEREPGVKAVLGHWLFGYIHPYPDGNGRMARFLMNVMLASGGFPWTVIRVDDRDEYLAALDSASIDLKIKPFAKFVAQCVKYSIDQNKREAKKSS